MTQRLGEPPRELRVVATDDGPVLFLTIAVEPRSCRCRTRTASRPSSRRRCAPQQGDLAEVVVHTEPA